MSLAFARGSEPAAVARVYFGLSERIEFAALEGAIDAISSDDRWERRAARDLAAELAWARIQLCRQVLDTSRRRCADQAQYAADANAASPRSTA